MAIFDIPVGLASVFTMILIGYFVLTVWFGSPQPQVIQKPMPLKKVDEVTNPSIHINAG